MVIIRRNPDGSIAGQEGQPTQSHPALATKMGVQALSEAGRVVPPLMNEIATKINNAKAVSYTHLTLPTKRIV